MDCHKIQGNLTSTTGICLIFAAATLDCHFTHSRRVYVSHPIHRVRACVRVDGSSFELRKRSADEDERKKITSYTHSVTVCGKNFEK